MVLVFWAASCEASLRQIQRVQELVDQVEPGGCDLDDPEVVAIAVHSPRMPIDDDIERLRHVLERQRIKLPAVHDPRFETWNRYEPHGWPSTAVIDRNGKVSGITAGCQADDVLAPAITAALTTPRTQRRRRQDQRELLERPSLSAEWNRRPQSSTRALRYPEGVATLRADQRPDGPADSTIAIADTGNDRVLIGRLTSAPTSFMTAVQIAGLDQPTSVGFLDRHRIAVIERGSNTVSVLEISTGRRTVVATLPVRPTSLTVDIDGSVVICDGGGDRIYRAVANSTGTGYLVTPIAGSGVVGTGDGPAGEAELAQPSGVTRTNLGLVFSDAASGNIRILTDKGEVVNITNSDLFDWGLIDGLAHRARLMRPSAVAALDDGSVIIVDSGNNRLRHLHQRHLSTLGLGGLAWPSDVATVDGSTVVVTDSDNHRLLLVDPEGQRAEVVAIEVADVVDAGNGDVHVSSGSAVAAT